MIAALENKQEELARLCAARGVKELYAFGSAVDGGFVEGKSDYDFLVRFFPCTPVEHADRYFGLLEDLQDTFLARIDLVEIDAITDSYFRAIADATRVPIYEEGVEPLAPASGLI